MVSFSVHMFGFNECKFSLNEYILFLNFFRILIDIVCQQSSTRPISLRIYFPQTGIS